MSAAAHKMSAASADYPTAHKLLQENSALKNLLVAWQNGFSEIETLYTNAEREKTHMINKCQDEISKSQFHLEESSQSVKEENENLSGEISSLKKDLRDVIAEVTTEYKRNKQLVHVLHQVRQQMKLILVEKELETIDRYAEQENDKRASEIRNSNSNKIDESQFKSQLEKVRNSSRGSISTSQAAAEAYQAGQGFPNEHMSTDSSEQTVLPSGARKTRVSLSSIVDPALPVNNPFEMEMACEKYAVRRQELRLKRDHLNAEIEALSKEGQEMGIELRTLQNEFETCQSPVDVLQNYIKSQGSRGIKQLLNGTAEFKQERNSRKSEIKTRKTVTLMSDENGDDGDGRNLSESQIEEEFLSVLNQTLPDYLPRLHNQPELSSFSPKRHPLSPNVNLAFSDDAIGTLEGLLWHDACQAANMSSFQHQLTRIESVWYFNGHKLQTRLLDAGSMKGSSPNITRNNAPMNTNSTQYELLVKRPLDCIDIQEPAIGLPYSKEKSATNNAHGPSSANAALNAQSTIRQGTNSLHGNLQSINVNDEWISAVQFLINYGTKLSFAKPPNLIKDF